ncbi:pyrroloquinoline quinone precursor peptide PqqA [Geodermatophilus sp. URMC 62]|jgi:coenzyme PQQ precursor peptide PqqA
MDQELCVSPPCAEEWESPSFEEIRVSAEATAYMGVQEDWD